MNNNIEILKILNNKHFDYMFDGGRRTSIFHKIETHNFVDDDERYTNQIFKCTKCMATIFFEYEVYYNHEENFNEILTCEEQIIKNIIE